MVNEIEGGARGGIGEGRVAERCAAWVRGDPATERAGGAGTVIG